MKRIDVERLNVCVVGCHDGPRGDFRGNIGGLRVIGRGSSDEEDIVDGKAASPVF